MLGDADLTTWRHDDDFRAGPTPMTVLDRELVIRAVNRSLERATGFEESQLVGRHIFEAFPANPGEPDGDDGQVSMASSFERVLCEKREHNLVVQRYDIPDPLDPERFVTRTWLPVNAPAWSAGDVVGVVIRSEEIALKPEADVVLRQFRDALRDAEGSDDDTTRRVVEAVVWGLRAHAAAAEEVRQLREALTSRSTIDQAKGILMARHRIDPDQAFQLLVRLSNDSNVRLADVARALVYQVQYVADPG